MHRPKPLLLTALLVVGIVVFLSGTTHVQRTILAAPRGATYTVTTTADSGVGSLRQAILDANASPGADSITFDIGAAGSQQTIAPLTNLPTISDPVLLDGWTQGGSGYTGPPLIEIDGSNLTASGNRGFRITAGASTVRGFIIHSFDDASSSAIRLHTADGNWITGNYIGTNAGGTAALPNHYGIWINNRGNSEPSHDNVIGTNGDGVDDALEGNVIAGSISEDVRVETNGNWIAGNSIGTTADGSAVLNSNNTGVRLYADGNVVGANGDGISDNLEGNLISGHDYGIGINNSSNHTIAGNIIGLDAAGGAILGNDFNGIDCNASAVASRDILIADNVISGNGSRGFSTFYNNCRHITITDNKIGTNITGTVALGNGAEGIIISAGDWYTITNNIISGNGTNGTAAGITTGNGANRLTISDNIIGSDVNGTADLGNTGDGVEIQFSNNHTIRNNQISGNGSEGVMISGSDAILVQENLIGVGADGSSALGNDDHGVYIFGNANGSAIVSNTIAYSGRHGVLIDGGSTTISNTISANSIFNNTQLGIDLDFDGVTPTDQDDLDTGPNGLQNHPAILSAANTAESITIEGVLDSTPDTTFTLEFFSNAVCDPEGNGEGALYLGSDTVTTLSGSGAANDTPYTITLPVSVPEGRYLSATATGAEGTSEFSVCYGPTGPVQDTPINGLTATNDGPQPDHNPVVLTATVSGGSNVSYTWDPGDGSAPQNGRVVTQTYTSPGTYTAVVTATNSVGQETASTEVTINRSASISGVVWDDVDGDGAVGPGETTFAGETVRASQGGRAYTATTDSNGGYVLRGLRAGRATLIAPAVSGFQSFGNTIRILSIPFDSAAVGQWLPYRANFSGVRGRAWLDDDFDSRYDTGETLLDGHLIDLTAVDGGTSFVNVPTDSDGLFQIDLSSGDGSRHILSGDTPALYQPISRTLNGARENGYTSNLAFRPGAIGGCVNATNGATADSLTLTLRDSSGQETATTTTDSNGCYVFSPGEAENAIRIRLTPNGNDRIAGPASQPAVYQDASLRIDWHVFAPGAVQIGIDSVDGVSVSDGQSSVSGYEVHLDTDDGVLTATTDFDGIAAFDNVTPGWITATIPLSGDDIGVFPASWSYLLQAGASVFRPGFKIGTHGVTAECRTPPVPGQEPNGRAFPCTVDLRYILETTPLVNLPLAAGEQFFYQPTTPPNESYNTFITITPDLPNGAELAASDLFFMRQGSSYHFRYPYFLPDQVAPISGEVWTDSNANGTREASEGAAVGFAVELLDANLAVVETTTTDTYGRYQFSPDSFGHFRVRLDVAASDRILPTTQQLRFIYRDNEELTGDVVDFGIALLSEGIEGRVRFSDLFLSNASGVTVQLFDPDDASTPLDSDTTGPSGHFRFDGLLPGDYLLRVLPPNGGTAVDRLVTASLSGTPQQEVILSPEGSQPTVFVYADENRNGEPNDWEGVPGLNVAFDLGACGNVAAVHLTDADGFATSELVFPDGGCARITSDLPDGLALAAPEGITLAPYQGGIVPLKLIRTGTWLVRPFWDVDGVGDYDGGEPILLEDVDVVSDDPAVTVTRLDNGFQVTGEAGFTTITVLPPPGGVVPVNQPISIYLYRIHGGGSTVVPIQFLGGVSGALSGPTSSAVAGRTVELVNSSGAVVATTTTSVPTASSPGGRSYTPPPAATGGPVSAPFSFPNVAPGTYSVRLVGVPPGTVYQGDEIIVHDPANPSNVALRLTGNTILTGILYWDNDADGARDAGEPGTQINDVVLLDEGGQSQTVTPAADGTFVFTGLQPGTQYAVTVPALVEGPGSGSAGSWITSAPGWFEMGSLTTAEIGLGTYAANNPNSLAAGQVYVRNGATRDPVPGATIGYYQLQSSAGLCNAANPTILGRTTSGADGRYRLPLTYIPGGNVQYCLMVLEAPGLVQDDLTVIADAAVAYTLPGGQTLYDQALNLDMDIKMRPVAGNVSLRCQAPGSEVVSEVSPTKCLAPQADVVVNWAAFRDDNLNGTWDAGEFPLPGVLLQSGAITATSSLDGSGALTLTNGQHTLSIMPPSGYAPVGPTTRTLWLNGSDADLPPIGFAPDGVVGGVVFADKDGDGWLSGTGNEFGLGDVTITLDGPVLTTTVTVADGRFSLPNLPDGDYTVSADLPAGHTANDATLTVSDGFGVVRLPAQSTSHLTGALYHDWDGDGLRLVDEELATSVPLTITVDGVGDVLPLGGSVLFWDVAPGSYTVEPWWTAAASTDVILGTNSGGGLGLPAVPPSVVRGVLWLDSDGDGVRQPWESPLSGIAVALDGGAAVVTDDHGRYTFVNVSTGEHVLEPQLPTGLAATVPALQLSAGRGAALGIPVSSATTNDSNVIFLPIILR
jgi:parallel beta-helix repeat protein